VLVFVLLYQVALDVEVIFFVLGTLLLVKKFVDHRNGSIQLAFRADRPKRNQLYELEVTTTRTAAYNL